VKKINFLFPFMLFFSLVFCQAQQNTDAGTSSQSNSQSSQAAGENSQMADQSSQSTGQSSQPADQNSQVAGQSSSFGNLNPVQLVAETTKAVDYRQGSKSEIAMKGSDQMPGVTGKAEVDTKSTPTQLKIEVEHLKPANSFGLEYLTYVAWAISPEGVPANLGELDVHDDKGSIRASTPMQAFALVISAEPYFAVSQPSEKLVVQNEPGDDTKGWIRSVEVHYQAVPSSLYSAQNQPIQNPVYGIDKNVPLALSEARNALRIAHIANAEQYAPSPLQRAQQLLTQADDYYTRKQPTKAIETVAREATQAAEAARVTSIRAAQQAKVDQERQAAMQRAARAEAEAELQARAAQQAKAQADAQAQQAQQAEQARQAAEQQAAQAQAAAQQAAQAAQAAQQAIQQQVSSGQQVQADQQAAAQQAQQQAEQARQQAAAALQRSQEQERLAQQAEQQLQQQRAAAAQAQEQLQQEQAARQQAQQQAAATQQQLQQAQQQVQQAQSEKEQTRQRLLGQLNQVLQTKDSARGLIVSMPDVLFALNSANLTTDARERLAKVAGILIAYPDIRVEVNGYTDNTGPLDFNQQLSQQRADAVRQYLVQQGVPSGSVESRGFGPSDPIASNDSPEGRKQNRRVNMVVSGQSIGAQDVAPAGPAQ
jgi:outer membrane protein OmpA-like peptidoglycan-associated protein